MSIVPVVAHLYIYGLYGAVQDTPSVKMTYSATVSAPSPLIVLMSAQTVSSSCGADSSTSPSSAPKLTDVSTGAAL